jgi:hypothetical protein
MAGVAPSPPQHQSQSHLVALPALSLSLECISQHRYCQRMVIDVVAISKL